MNPLALRLPRRIGATLAVACLALALCVPAQAGGTARRTMRPRPAVVHPAKPIAPPATRPAAAPGMVIAIDPETGALVAPTAEQVHQLTAAERTGLLRTAEGLAEVRYPDGSVKLDLQGRFMEFSVVQLDRDGCPHFRCVSDEAVLRALLAPRAPASHPVLEEK